MRTNAHEVLTEIESNLKNLIFDTVSSVEVDKSSRSLQAAQRLRSEVLSKIARIKESPKKAIMLGEFLAWAQGIAEYLRSYQGLNQRHFDQVREAMTNLKTPYHHNISLSEKERTDFICALETVRNGLVIKDLTTDMVANLEKLAVRTPLLKVFSFLFGRIRGSIATPMRTDISLEEYYGIMSLAFVLNIFDEDTTTQVFKVGLHFLTDSSIASQKKDHESTH